MKPKKTTNTEYIKAIVASRKMPRITILDSAKRKFIEENIQLNVLEKYHQ
jgi:hypothetical protein